VTIDAMREEDWPACALIYEQGLDTGTFEESVPAWGAWNASHLPEPRLVARDEAEIVGWAALAPVSRRACYRGVTENSIYVANGARGRGVGRALLEELVRRAEELGLWTI
jgi:L-amino acid N-acyltransferase YncA